MSTADSYFYIGKTHNVCEDYAFAGVVKRIPETVAALVSDGCSGSTHTDFGSRLLIRSAFDRIASDGQGFNAARVIYDAAAMAKQLGLEDRSLDATLLSLVSDNTSCEARVLGDGVLIKVDCAGNVIVYKFEFESGMPFYLSYHLDRKRKSGYFLESNKAAMTTSVYKNGVLVTTDTTCFDGDDVTEYPRYRFLSNDLRLLAVATDGVCSFQSKAEPSSNLEPVDFMKVVEQLLDIKGYNGEFVKRRCKRFLHTFCPNNRWQHSDDVAVAAIHFG